MYIHYTNAERQTDIQTFDAFNLSKGTSGNSTFETVK